MEKGSAGGWKCCPNTDVLIRSIVTGYTGQSLVFRNHTLEDLGVISYHVWSLPLNVQKKTNIIDNINCVCVFFFQVVLIRG